MESIRCYRDLTSYHLLYSIVFIPIGKAFITVNVRVYITLNRKFENDCCRRYANLVVLIQQYVSQEHLIL